MATAEIKTRASLDSKGFDIGIKKMQQSVSSWKNGQLKQMAGAIGGAFAVSAAWNFAKGAVEVGDQLSDLAGLTGLATDELQALTAAAADYGGTQDDVINGLIKFKELQSEVARSGAGGLKKTLDDLGMSATEFTGDTKTVIEAIAKLKPSASMMGDLFGSKKIRTLSGAMGELGKGGFDQLVKDRSGSIMSASAIAGAGMLDDKLGQLKKGAQAMLLNVADKFNKLTPDQRAKAEEEARFQKDLQKQQEETAAIERRKQLDKFKTDLEKEGKEKKEKEMKNFKVSEFTASDVFAAKGGFSGTQLGQQNTMRSLAERTLRELEIQTELDQDMNKKLGGD